MTHRRARRLAPSLNDCREMLAFEELRPVPGHPEMAVAILLAITVTPAEFLEEGGQCCVFDVLYIAEYVHHELTTFPRPLCGPRLTRFERRWCTVQRVTVILVLVIGLLLCFSQALHHAFNLPLVIACFIVRVPAVVLDSFGRSDVVKLDIIGK